LPDVSTVGGTSHAENVDGTVDVEDSSSTLSKLVRVDGSVNVENPCRVIVVDMIFKVVNVFTKLKDVTEVDGNVEKPHGVIDVNETFAVKNKILMLKKFWQC
jgi:hypothetical protein